MTGSAILSIVYGIDALEEKDPYLEVVDRSVHIGATEGAFGKYLVVRGLFSFRDDCL